MITYLIIFQGSGKTYTIGSSNTSELLDDEYGVIPRALEQIFHVIQVDKLFVNTSLFAFLLSLLAF
jgi:hypothetical protein